jgi:hypothetical protein
MLDNRHRAIPFSTGATKYREKYLNWYYYFWAFLVFVQAIVLTFSPQSKVVTYALIGYLGFGILKNINNPRELIFLFILAYLTNIRNWFTYFEIVGGTGSRILLADVYLVIIILSVLVHFILHHKFSKIYLGRLLIIITLLWGFNFFRGLLYSQFGYVIGEGRFYLAAVFLLAIPSFWENDFEYNFRKLLHIVCLASICIAFLILVMLFSGLEIAGSDGRYNPGNGNVQILVFSLLIALLDFIKKQNYHLINISKPLLVAIFLGFIFISGVRSMILVTMAIFFYFFIVSNLLSLGRKLMIIGALVALAIIALQIPAVRTVWETQAEFIEIAKGEGGKHAKTSADFRQEMWLIFINHILEDNERIFLGRPFDNEKIDISSLGWQHAKEPTVDNSLAHNDFVAIAMTNGFVFTGLFLLAIGLFVLKGIRIGSSQSRFSYFYLFMGLALFVKLFKAPPMRKSNTMVGAFFFGFT